MWDWFCLDFNWGPRRHFEGAVVTIYIVFRNYIDWVSCFQHLSHVPQHCWGEGVPQDLTCATCPEGQNLVHKSRPVSRKERKLIQKHWVWIIGIGEISKWEPLRPLPIVKTPIKQNKTKPINIAVTMAVWKFLGPLGLSYDQGQSQSKECKVFLDSCASGLFT